MIITCVNCSKKFDVESNLIPENGRLIICGSCGHKWFYKKEEKNKILYQKKDDFSAKLKDQEAEDIISEKKPVINKIFENTPNSKVLDNNENKDLKKIDKVEKKIFSLGKIFSYFIVFIVSFIGLIIIMDTFKTPIINYFPNFEIILFNFYETLKDIRLFIIDLK
tara:strand:- start:109 stop:603 length:495 start_codon:yes stop_codon:yes gene_type:complete